MLTCVDGDSMALKVSPRRQGAPWGQVVSPIATRGEEKEDGPSVLSLFRASSILGSGVMADTALPAISSAMACADLPCLFWGVGQAGLHS